MKYELSGLNPEREWSEKNHDFIGPHQSPGAGSGRDWALGAEAQKPPEGGSYSGLMRRVTLEPSVPVHLLGI
jgi:hypothetical protein